jgi:hypothetical protein
MKGYVYLDNDDNLNVRTLEFIEGEDPGFWGRNAHFINIVWKFDSEDKAGMYDLLSSLKRKELPTRKVSDFCKSIGFNLEAFVKERTPTNASNF